MVFADAVYQVQIVWFVLLGVLGLIFVVVRRDPVWFGLLFCSFFFSLVTVLTDFVASLSVPSEAARTVIIVTTVLSKTMLVTLMFLMLRQVWIECRPVQKPVYDPVEVEVRNVLDEVIYIVLADLLD